MEGESCGGCCGAPSDALDAGDVRNPVKEYYGKVLSSSADLKTSACTSGSTPNAIIQDLLLKIPIEITNKFYGCGTPIPLGIEGLSVLDLGSGSGRDCYLASALVGEKGRVTGIDMTDEQINIARLHVEEFTKTLGYSKPNMEFRLGYIEALEETGVAKDSYDLVISNCVFNLSPAKPAVLQGVYDSLRAGGELYFSDVYCSRRLPEDVKKHEILWDECISGALYIEDFKRICHSVGFTDPRALESSEIVIKDPKLAAVVGEAKFYSITFRCFKLPGKLETLCEDYGQLAIYKGTIPGSPHAYTLDDHHRLEKGKPFLVCGNTAAMLGDSWLAPHFQVIGDRSVHYGLFDCMPQAFSNAAAAASSEAVAGGCC